MRAFSDKYLFKGRIERAPLNFCIVKSSLLLTYQSVILVLVYIISVITFHGAYRFTVYFSGAAVAHVQANCDAALAADSERLLMRASNLARTWINAADPNVSIFTRKLYILHSVSFFFSKTVSS